MMNFDKTTNTSIADSPFKLTVYPNKASAQYSYVNGSGIHAVTVGLIADIYLQVKDIYNNDYNKDTLLDKQVYNITVICNSTYSIPVNLTDSSVLSKVQFINQHIIAGQFHFEYIILDLFLEAQVSVMVYSLDPVSQLY